MKNIIEEKPTDEIHGRTLYNTLFVDDADIKEKKILDIGCGFGWMELSLLNRGAAKVTGIENTEKSLETARKYIEDERIDFQVGSAIDLPFEEDSFNTIIAWEVIEHIPKNTEGQMFSEANRVLKSGGTFYLSTPHSSFFSNIFDPAWWLIGHRHYGQGRLVKIGKENGFAVELLEIRGGWWEILSMLNLYIAKWIFRRRPFFKSFFNKKQDKEYEKSRGFAEIFIKFRKNG
jgi:ubiquinone/menaquinone biosynthesis C-methylase UbiE